MSNINSKYKIIFQRKISCLLIRTDHFEIKYDKYISDNKYTAQELDLILDYRQELRDCNKDKFDEQGNQTSYSNDHSTWIEPTPDKLISKYL
jgi:hypothetical protein